MAGKTAQKPSQLRQALQICMTRATSVSSSPRSLAAGFAAVLACHCTGCSAARLAMAGMAAARAWRVSSSSCFTLRSRGSLRQRRGGGAGAGNAAEGRADRHADAGGVALAQQVAGHPFAGPEQVVAGLAVKADRGGSVH